MVEEPRRKGKEFFSGFFIIIRLSVSTAWHNYSEEYEMNGKVLHDGIMSEAFNAEPLHTVLSELKEKLDSLLGPRLSGIVIFQ